MSTQPTLTAKSATLGLLSRRSYSTDQLRRKLVDRGYEIGIIETALRFATEHGWLNDDLYAKQLTRSRICSGYGSAYIRQYLRSKGIDAELASTTLDDDQWDWWEAIERAFHKKYKNLPLEWKLQQKCSAYLYRRGFDSPLIYSYFDYLRSTEES